MAGIAGLWTDLTVQLRADRKKAAVLFGLSAILLTVVLRATLMGRNAPAPVSAASDLLPTSAGPTVVQPTTSDVMVAAPLDGRGSATNCESVDTSTMPRDMLRDLFHTDWNAFPPSAEYLARNEKKAAVAATRPSVWNGAWTSIAGFIEQHQQEVRASHERATREAGELKLQGTFGSDPPRAIVNGRSVRIGDVIGGFRVTAISNRHVTVLKSGLSVDLTMP